MTPAEIISSFKSSNFDIPADANRFLTAAGQLDAPTLVKLLEVLTARGATANAAVYHRRCAVFGALAAKTLDINLFVPYVRALKGADFTLKQTLSELIPKVPQPAQFGELAALLNQADANLRQTAARLLVQLGGRVAFERLSEVIKDKKCPGRPEALDAVVRIGGHFALPIIQGVLASGTPQERTQVLTLMGESPSIQRNLAEALQLMASALNDPIEAVAAAAVSSFVKYCNEDQWFDAISPVLETERVTLLKAALEGLKRFRSPRVTRVLEHRLRKGPNAVRLMVLNVLESIGNDEALPPLVEALGSKHLAVRNKAGEVLSSLSRAGKLDVTRTVLWLLKSHDPNVRRMALEIARSVKDPQNQLWPKMMTLLRDEDWWVRERVVDVLVELAGTQLTRHIAAFLNDPSDIVRRFAINVLVRLKDPASVGALVRTIQSDSDWWVRERALEAVGAIGDVRSIPYLQDVLRKSQELRWSALKAVLDVNAKPAAAEVVECLKDKDPEVRFIALQCLEKFNEPSRSDAVRSLVTDTEPRIRDHARRVLAHWNIAFTAEMAKIAEGATPLDKLLTALASSGGDDLIISPGRPPMMKKMGKVLPLSETEISPEQTRLLLMPRLSPVQTEELKNQRDVDYSYEIRQAGLRFRANVFNERGGLAAVFRIIRGTVPQFATLGLPPSVAKLGDLSNGLVLIGGPTGSGKSTTLAALIASINQNSSRHIIALEDPIEVVHEAKKCLVTQREVGSHTYSYGAALRSTLREDPDVILVGELRDLTTISFAVTAAETGHLVFGTVHTVSVDNSVDRLISAFPAAQHEQVRSMLAQSLRGVVCQFLLKSADGKSRHLATEVLINNEAIAALIRKGKTFQIPSVLATAGEEGMQSMDQSLMKLLKAGSISPEEAYLKARSKKEFEPFVPGAAQAATAAGAEPKPSAPTGAAARPVPLQMPAKGAM